VKKHSPRDVLQQTEAMFEKPVQTFGGNFHAHLTRTEESDIT